MSAAPDNVLRALADVERLAMAGSLAGGEGYTAGELADRLDIPLPRVRRHLNRLTAAAVIRLEFDRQTYRLDANTLREAALQVGPPREPGVEPGSSPRDDAVIRAFFREGRLLEIPVKGSKRRIVLERLALTFEPGVTYSEREVNTILGAFHEDVASLRRYLVDEGLLERANGVYVRVASG